VASRSTPRTGAFPVKLSNLKSYQMLRPAETQPLCGRRKPTTLASPKQQALFHLGRHPCSHHLTNQTYPVRNIGTEHACTSPPPWGENTPSSHQRGLRFLNPKHRSDSAIPKHRYGARVYIPANSPLAQHAWTPAAAADWILRLVFVKSSAITTQFPRNLGMMSILQACIKYSVF
jgi:hypothetical protein